jgi:diguanylate cyclase
MQSEAGNSDFSSATTSRPSDTQHELAREALKPMLANALEYARMSQRFVATLMVTLARPDKLEALLGVPSTDVMRRALKRLPQILRPADRYVRISDDKICVLLPNLKSSTQAWLAANKIRQTLEAPFSFENSMIVVRPVIGIACFPDHAKFPEELVVNADIANAIANNRDLSLHIFQPEDSRDLDVYSGLEALLRDALRANSLEVHYQPQVDLKTGRCETVEALLRWTVPERGIVDPTAIVRVAEANGLINQLTSWVMNTVFRNQSEWRRDGINVGVSVNLSTVSLGESDLPEIVEQCMGTWQVKPSDLTLEITESSTIGDIDQSLIILQRLKEKGLRLSVDDFGTGNASLSYVKRFPLDELKIDKSFVQHMRKSKGDQQIVRSVIDLAHHFELSVVAEGVEDEATYNDLKKFGCDVVQGFYVSKALPDQEIKAWLRGRRK